MNVLESIIQGIIQGFTEFLPISSSGHLMIAQYFLGIKENNLFFSISLHIGTLISVLLVYKKTFLDLFKSIFSLPVSLISGRKKTKSEDLLVNIFISLIPLFFLIVPIPKMGSLRKFASYLSDSGNISIVGISLIVTSILLYLGIKSSGAHAKYGNNEMTPLKSFFVGIFQMFAGIFPGLSRSGSTLSAGLIMGVDRKEALDFSFILGTPTILIAALAEFKEVHDLGIKIDLLPLLVGILVSAFVGCLSIKLFKWLMKNDKTWFFALYCFVVGSSVILLKILKLC